MSPNGVVLEKNHKILDIAFKIFVLLMFIWGLRVLILEGFVYSWPRKFGGDFYEVMFGPDYWDGSGFVYGPVFTGQKIFVENFPNFFNPYSFAILNVFFATASLIFCSFAIGLKRKEILLILAIWTCFMPLTYAFSVSANPEFLELFFLSLSWYFLARNRLAKAWISVLAGALTKVIPVVFFCILVFRRSLSAFLATFSFFAITVVGIGLLRGMSPLQAVSATLIPSLNMPGSKIEMAGLIRPVPSSFQMLGLNSAIARAFGLTDSLEIVQYITWLISGLVFLISGLIIARLLTGSYAIPERTKLNYSYIIVFLNFPLLTQMPHPHTFIFLLPAFTGLAWLSLNETNLRTKICLSVSLSILYLIVGTPGVVIKLFNFISIGAQDFFLLNDPIWANLVLIVISNAYVYSKITRSKKTTSEVILGGI
jgi:hypothetical protein